MKTKMRAKQLIIILKSKFVVASIVFIVWVALFDENNLIERRNMMKEYRQLEKDKKYYTEEIEKDAARLQELQTNNDNLEKFAREQYLMHREDEDVFVIVEE